MYKLFWKLHKWVGISMSLLVLLSAGSGFLLLLKKDFDWIQPPVREDHSEGSSPGFIPLERLFEVVLGAGSPDFQELGDITRVDYRPGSKVFKVHSRHRNAEIQVGALSGEILSRGTRWSDWLEDLHDGSLLAEWFHDIGMLVFAGSLVFLALMGLYLWLRPLYRKHRRRRRLLARSSA